MRNGALKHFNIGDAVLILLLASVTFFLLARTLLTGVTRLWVRSWTRATALIQPAGARDHQRARGLWTRWLFRIQLSGTGARYVGCFVIMSKQIGLNPIQQKLSGQRIQIRFNPSHPETSFLEHLRDPLFERYKATQQANWIGQTPNPGLRSPFS